MKRFFTKATTRESGNPRLSFNWVRSRRAWFKIFDDRVECGDWVISTADITGAVLYRAGFSGGSVLELQTEAETYQFGFNPWVRLKKHLPFEVEERQVRLSLSTYSLVVRLVLVLYLAWVAWRWFSG